MEYGVTGYCVPPPHVGKPYDEVQTHEASSDELGFVKWVMPDPETQPYSYLAHADPRAPGLHKWDSGLVALRNTVVHESFACIVAGGRTVLTHEVMPSVAHDALVALRDQRPLYVLGGLGGCAADIAAVLRLTDSQPSTHGSWHGMDAFAAHIGSDHLHNGLDPLENQTLAETTDVEKAISLVLRGLDRLVAQHRNWPW